METAKRTLTNEGIKLRNQAQDVVIGGCGLLSKRPTRYSSSYWPTYYKSAKKISITTLDGCKYKDFSEFSIGCNLFGYSVKGLRPRDLLKESYPATTLLSPEEVSLAKKLNEFIEEQRIWKFCRGGGESLL